MSDLKPCTFCGNENPEMEERGVVLIRCFDCGIQTPEYHVNDIDFSEVKDDWNTRTTDRLVEENKELREFAMYCQGFLGCEETRGSMALHGITIRAKELLNKLEAKQC